MKPNTQKETNVYETIPTADTFVTSGTANYADPNKNYGSARKLADYLTSPPGQIALRVFAAREDKGLLIFYSVTAGTAATHVP